MRLEKKQQKYEIHQVKAVNISYAAVKKGQGQKIREESVKFQKVLSYQDRWNKYRSQSGKKKFIVYDERMRYFANASINKWMLTQKQNCSLLKIKGQQVPPGEQVYTAWGCSLLFKSAK